MGRSCASMRCGGGRWKQMRVCGVTVWRKCQRAQPATAPRRAPLRRRSVRGNADVTHCGWLGTQSSTMDGAWRKQAAAVYIQTETSGPVSTVWQCGKDNGRGTATERERGRERDRANCSHLKDEESRSGVQRVARRLRHPTRRSPGPLARTEERGGESLTRPTTPGHLLLLALCGVCL